MITAFLGGDGNTYASRVSDHEVTIRIDDPRPMLISVTHEDVVVELPIPGREHRHVTLIDHTEAVPNVHSEKRPARRDT